MNYRKTDHHRADCGEKYPVVDRRIIVRTHQTFGHTHLREIVEINIGVSAGK